MEVNRKTRVTQLLTDGDMRDVLAWYGLPVDERLTFRTTLEDFCDAYGVDVEDVLVELSMAEVESDDQDMDDEDDIDWLSA